MNPTLSDKSILPDDPPLPDSFRRFVGELPSPGRLPDDDGSGPYETIRPTRDGYVKRDGVRCWHAVWGSDGPWLAFAPSFQMVHSQLLKATVPWLSDHFRVVTTDGRGNGRSDRPRGKDAYSFDHYFADFTAVLDAAGADRAALVGISAAAMTVLRLAAEQPERVSHLVIAGGFAETMFTDPAELARALDEHERLRTDWPAFVDKFVASIFTEPHSTKPFEDGVRYGWSTSAEVIGWCRNGWRGNDVRELARRVRCPTLVIHGDDDQRVAWNKGETIHELVPGSRMLTVAAGGHVTAVRDPVLFNRCVRDFVAGAPRRATWTRAMSRRRKALLVSSPIGLGHVQRDLAIARELRKLEPELDIDWFTTDPARRYLEAEGERLHPITQRLASESGHFESVAGEHDLHAFFALRSIDEVMARNFMVFDDLMEQEHYDLVIGDEAWEVDYYYHENPDSSASPLSS